MMEVIVLYACLLAVKKNWMDHLSYPAGLFLCPLIQFEDREQLRSQWSSLLRAQAALISSSDLLVGGVFRYKAD